MLRAAWFTISFVSGGSSLPLKFGCVRSAIFSLVKCKFELAYVVVLTVIGGDVERLSLKIRDPTVVSGTLWIEIVDAGIAVVVDL